jgi:hypothetical protein
VGAANGPAPAKDADAKNGETDSDTATTAESHIAKLEFAPLWDARQEAVTGYVCLPRAQEQPADMPAELRLPDQRERAAAELSRFQAAASLLAHHLEQGERYLLVFPVSFEFIGAPASRMEFTAACRGLPSDIRRYINFELTDIPGGIPHSRLADLVAALRPFARAVMARVITGRYGFEAFSGAGLQAIGLDLTQQKSGERDTQNEVLRLCAAAKRSGLMTYLFGVADLFALRLGYDQEIHFMSGSAISPALDRPRSISRLGWASVVRNAQRQSAA